MHINRILIIIFVIMFIILIIIPPPSMKFSSVVGNRRGAGLFSVINANYISSIIYCRENGIDNIYIKYKDIKNQYSTKDTDINQYLVSDCIKNNGINYNIFQQIHNLLWSGSYANYMYGFGNRTKFPATSSKSLLTIHNYIKDSFDFKPKYHNIADNFLSDYTGYYIFGVHYRGGDTIHHYPYVKQNPKWFVQRLQQLTQELNRPYKVLVCSIDKECYSIFETVFKDELIYFNNDIDINGSQSDFGNWQNTNESGTERAENAILDCLLLSKCDYLIKNRSNISETSLILNPHIPCTIIFSDKEVFLKKENEYRFTGPYNLKNYNL